MKGSFWLPLEGAVTTTGRHGRQDHEATGRLALSDKNQREMNAGAILLLHFFLSWTPAHGALHSGHLPISAKPLCKLPQRHASDPESSQADNED